MDRAITVRNEEHQGGLALKRFRPTDDQIKLVKTFRYKFHDEDAAKAIGENIAYVEKDHTCHDCPDITVHRCQELFADVIDWPWTGPGNMPQYCYVCFNRRGQKGAEWLLSMERIINLKSFKDKVNGTFPVSKEFFLHQCNRQWQRKKSFDKGHARLRNPNWVNLKKLLNSIEELHPATKNLSQTQKRKWLIYNSWDIAHGFMKSVEKLSPEKQA